jgi:hypothetical protein
VLLAAFGSGDLGTIVAAVASGPVMGIGLVLIVVATVFVDWLLRGRGTDHRAGSRP